MKLNNFSMVLMLFTLLSTLALVFSSKVLLSICIFSTVSGLCIARLNDIHARDFDIWDYIYNKIKRS
ncbi:hypothetical protein [Pseudoalteromonas phage vB_PtuP_Slicky01]|nr:hypothetical protein [Pseudoalteromonas phage vB_PtuP_Slicky01]